MTVTNDFSDTTNPSVVLRLQEIRSFYDQIGLGGLWDSVILPEVIRDPTLTSRELLQNQTIQNSDVYKQRFAANEQRVKNGLQPLNPVDYIQLEQTYKDAMAQAGLPKGFYDQPDDFQNWIGNDVSASEVQSRVATAVDAYNTLAASNPQGLQAAKDWYGVDRDGVLAYMLDADRAVPLLEKQHQLQAIKYADTANTYNVGLTRSQAERAAANGISQDDAANRFRQVAADSDQANTLSSIYGNGVTEQDLVNEALGFDDAGDVTKRKKRLASQERAAFNGSSGMSSTSLSQRGVSI